jgi:hypothetical protein
MTIHIPDLPEPPPHVFMLATPAHMLTKLHWEIHNLRKALSERAEHIGHIHAPAYCAFNCAVTAWHLADWTWKAGSPEQRACILSSFGIESTGAEKDFTKFQIAVVQGSRALRICRQIATGSKHMKVTQYPDPDIRAESGLERIPTASTAVLGQAIFGKAVSATPVTYDFYRLVVHDKGVQRPALEIFDEAFNDWEQFLGQWGFVEGKLVAAG